MGPMDISAIDLHQLSPGQARRAQRKKERTELFRLTDRTWSELHKASVAVVVEKALGWDIVVGSIESLKWLRFILIFAIINIINNIRHIAFLFMDRSLSVYFGNYFFLLCEPDSIIHLSIISGQCLTIACAFTFYYYGRLDPSCLPAFVRAALRAQATINGVIPSSLPLRTITKIRKRLEVIDIVLKLAVFVIVVPSVHLVYLGYSLVGGGFLMITVVIWPWFVFFGGNCTLLVAYVTTRMFVSYCMVVSAQQELALDRLESTKMTLMVLPRGNLQWQTVVLQAQRRTLRVIRDCDKTRRDVEAANRFWSKPVFGIALTSLPAVILTMYCLITKDLGAVAIFICFATCMCIGHLGLALLFYASRVNSQVNKIAFHQC